MSASYEYMQMAAGILKAADKISVIDSANLSTGIGLLVVEAAVMAAEGSRTRDEIVARIEELKPLVRASFVVDTLVYLHRGGRCSGVAAIAGTALKLHPKIMVEDGAMRPDKKYRGKYSNIVLEYAKDMEEQLKTAKKDRVFITHSPIDPAVTQAVREYLQSLNRFDEILETTAGGVISSHCGPGTLGVLFIAEN
jgi:DegV family protein with EDD domain